jgi:hypothetical protein
MDLFVEFRRLATMIIEITDQDIWNEFVHYRKIGRKKLAFEHIRVHGTKAKFEAILAGIAYRKYNPQLGDIIIAGENSQYPYEFMWDDETEAAFYELKTDLFNTRPINTNNPIQQSIWRIPILS